MSAPVLRLGVSANLTRPRAGEGLAALARAAREQGVTLLPDPETARALPGAQACAVAGLPAAGAQALAALGGDGTLLAAAHALAQAGADLPLIGLNVGRLGYLTAVNEEAFPAILRALAAGRYAQEARATLAAAIHAPGGAQDPLPDALNDVVVSRGEGGHAIAIELALDDHPVARWLCDGLILATPTGSTAYNLSVGGPVVAPTADALVVSVIAPHALTARPLVIPGDTRVAIRVAAEAEAPAAVYVDGQAAHPLRPGETLRATRSPRPVRLLTPLTRNPYAPLSRKLGWGTPFAR